jgi:indoleamine 2,3-dioxygenase
MHNTFSEMWNESSPKNYLNFRTYIMGITGNDDIFPGGVLYKGVSDKKLSFRGETGA